LLLRLRLRLRHPLLKKIPLDLNVFLTAQAGCAEVVHCRVRIPRKVQREHAAIAVIV
jgi:hypothetical protein